MDTLRLILRNLFLWLWPVFVVFLAMMAVSNTAQAADRYYQTQGQAYSGCMAESARVIAVANNPTPLSPSCAVVSSGQPAGYYRCRYTVNSNGSSGPCSNLVGSAHDSTHYWTQACPADSPWDPVTSTCASTCTGGAIKMTNGSCSPKPEECLARNAEPGFANVGDTTRNFASHCVGGCQFGVSGPHTQTTHGSQTMVTGTFEFSGGVCGASPSAPPQPDTDVLPDKAQECGPAGANQTFCVKANGDHCATSSAGRQICWKPGETGEKVDGKTLQKRQPGETPTPPRTPPPDGDEWNPPSEPIKTTTQTKDAAGNVTNNITTVITNQTTKSGVDAGKGNQGEKGDGSGDDKGDSEEGEKGQYSADCSKSPTCSQTDGIGCAIVRQQWSNKCDALRGDVNQIGNTNELPTAGLESSLIDVWDQGNGYIPGPTDVDKTGWAGRGSCPINIEFSAMGKSFNVNHPQLCEILDALAALIMIVGSWHAGFILTTGFRKG